MSGGSVELVDPFGDEKCLGYAAFGNGLVLIIIFHWLLVLGDCKDWARAVRVCTPFRDAGYCEALRRKVCRVLGEMTLEISLMSERANHCWCGAYRRADEAGEVMKVRHRRIKNHLGVRVEGLQAQDNTLIYDMGLDDEMKTPLKAIRIHYGGKDKKVVVAWNSDSHCNSFYLDQGSESMLTKRDAPVPNTDLDW